MLNKLFGPKKEDICPNCGTACFATDVLCPKCGKNLEDLFEQLPNSDAKSISEIKKNNIWLWRLVNTVVMVIGLVMPWISFDLDFQVANEALFRPSGLKFFILFWGGIIDDLQANGLKPEMLPFWLVGVSGILLFLYVIFNVMTVSKKRRYKENKAVAIILVAIVVILLFPVFIGGRAYLGYWLVNLGILSSAILEW